VLVTSTLSVMPEKYNPRYFTLFSQGIGKLSIDCGRGEILQFFAALWAE